MSFQSRLSRLPQAYSKEIAQEVDSLVPYAQGEIRLLIEGAIGSSPYLYGLVAKEADWLEGALDDPEAALAALSESLTGVGVKELPVALRQAKRRVALLTARKVEC